MASGRRRVELGILGAVIAGAALVRFWDLGAQSYWRDEAYTVWVVRDSLGAVFDRTAATESTPPLYYLLGWVWAHVAGTGETQLRSLSALAGTLTVPAAWAAVRQVGTPVAALVAAILVGVSPALVWFSQEARAYSLLVLLTTVALWLCLRARRTGRSADLAAWAAAGVAALCTHYYAAFFLLPQALLLLSGGRERARRAAPGIAVVTAVGLALVPLAAHQSAHSNWIGATSLSSRLDELWRDLSFAGTELISSNSPAPDSPLRWLAAVALVVAIGGALVSRGRERRALAPMLAVFGLGLLVPLVLTLTPLDSLKDRNLLSAWVPFLALAAIALCAERLRGLGILAALGLCAAAMHVNYRVVTDPALQRSDYRGLARAMADAGGTRRAVAVLPISGALPLALYGVHLAPVAAGTPVSELDFAGELGPLGSSPPPGPRGFRLASARQVGGLWLLRYRAARPRPLGRPGFHAPRAETWLQTSSGPTALRRLAVDGLRDSLRQAP